MFQTGYLTITGYDEESTLYTLGSPNLETKRALHSLGIAFQRTAKKFEITAASEIL
jgi:hypothetical protein